MTPIQETNESDTFVPKNPVRFHSNPMRKWICCFLVIVILLLLGVIIGVIAYFLTKDNCTVDESCQANLQILRKLNISVRSQFYHKFSFVTFLITFRQI